MRVEQRFNKRTAPLVECQPPHISVGGGLALGVAVSIFPDVNVSDNMKIGALRMHMTPGEAISFAIALLNGARAELRNKGHAE